MKGCIVALVAVIVLLVVMWAFGVMLPERLIGSGLENFEGTKRRMASQALFHIADFYGNGFLEIGDYNGPPLVLGWHVKSVEECPGAPSRGDFAGNSYRAVVGAYSLFGVPRGEMEVTCSGHRNWEPYF